MYKQTFVYLLIKHLSTLPILSTECVIFKHDIGQFFVFQTMLRLWQIVQAGGTTHFMNGHLTQMAPQKRGVVSIDRSKFDRRSFHQLPIDRPAVKSYQLTDQPFDRRVMLIYHLTNQPFDRHIQ